MALKFKSTNDFCLHIEHLKQNLNLETYTETMIWFYENETDHEFDHIVKLLNKKILCAIENEARNAKLLKDNTPILELF